jgi:hypothetical protein
LGTGGEHIHRLNLSEHGSDSKNRTNTDNNTSRTIPELLLSRNLLRERTQKDFPKGDVATSKISKEGSKQDNNLRDYLHGELRQDFHRERAQIKYQSLFMKCQ